MLPESGGEPTAGTEARGLSVDEDIALRALVPTIPAITSPADCRPTHVPTEMLRASQASTSSRGGVTLTEVIAPDATVLRRKSSEVSQLQAGSPFNNKPGVAESRVSGQIPAQVQQKTTAATQDVPAPSTVPPRTLVSLRRFGNTNRTMSYRGTPPRLLKVRMVAKVDSKSYFSVERTMYQWMYIGTSVIGYGLSLYGYHGHADLGVQSLACQSATLLACLGMLVAYYAAASFYRRRDALRRMRKAAAFDDRVAPRTITLLIAAVFVVYVILSWMSYDSSAVQLKRTSFGVKKSQFKHSV